MPFEPLQTDEKLDKPVQKVRDMDAAMLFGCSGFVLTSILGYLLSVWPFIVFRDTEVLASLGLSCLCGLTPAAVLGVLATRKFGLAGACGFVGGSMATAIFLFLRIEQSFIAASARQAPKPEYPQLLQYLVPLCWVLVSLILAILVIPREESGERS